MTQYSPWTGLLSTTRHSTGVSLNRPAGFVVVIYYWTNILSLPERRLRAGSTTIRLRNNRDVNPEQFISKVKWDREYRSILTESSPPARIEDRMISSQQYNLSRKLFSGFVGFSFGNFSFLLLLILFNISGLKGIFVWLYFNREQSSLIFYL